MGGRNGANGAVQSAVERHAAESQSEAPDECRFPCPRPGRAGAEWGASATAEKGSGAGQWATKRNAAAVGPDG